MSDLPPTDPLDDALRHPGERDADRIIARLGHGSTPVIPPAGARERLLARARQETQAPLPQQEPPIIRTSWRWLPLTAAAALMVGLVPAWHWYGESCAAARDRAQDRSALQDLHVQLELARTQASGVRAQLDALHSDYTTLQTQATTLGDDKLALQSQVTALQADKIGLQAQATALQADKVGLQAQATAMRDEADNLRGALAAARRDLADAQTQVATLRDEAARNEEALSILRSSKIQSFILHPTADGRPGYARILWDQQNRRWHLRTEGLPVPAPGRTYELWFITGEQRKVAAGTFDVDAKGAGTLLLNLPPGLNDIALAAITDEPRGGAQQPTGTIHLAGKLP